jgi:FkbM family methyltransferase
MASYSHVDSKGIPLDQKLDELFRGKEGGFFIELGANDGLAQSNTAFFEFYRGWKGILVEPSPTAYEACKAARPFSSCYNVACVSAGYEGATICGDFTGGLMSSVGGERMSAEAKVEVPASTLTALIDAVGSPDIDLLSLDAEGYELNILQGLDLERHRPHYMLIEVYTKEYDALCEYLSLRGYNLVENFTNYNLQDNPCWDGTHNDYLFVDLRRGGGLKGH